MSAMMGKVRACVLVVGAVAMSGLLGGCIYVDRGGHGGGGRHCEVPARYERYDTVCVATPVAVRAGGHWR